MSKLKNLILVVFTLCFATSVLADNKMTFLSHFNDSASWNINEANGDAADGSGSATVGSSATHATGFFSGSTPTNGALSFTSSTGDDLSYSATGNVDYTSPTSGGITVGCWHKFTVSSGGTYGATKLFSVGTSTDYAEVWYGSGAAGKARIRFSENGSLKSADSTVNTDYILSSWVYFALTVDLDNQQCTLRQYSSSGSLLATTTLSITVSGWDAKNGSIAFGGYMSGDTDQYFFDEFSIDNYVLTAAEIQTRVDSMVAGSQLGSDPVEKATAPSPIDASADVSIGTILSWTNGLSASSHDIYFGTDAAQVAAADRSSALYQGNVLISEPSEFTPDLDYSTTYYWRVDTVDASDTLQWQGDVWSFTTVNEPVTKATNPAPADAASAVNVSQILSWTNGDLAASHDIYIGTDAAQVAAADRNSDLYKTNIPTSSPSSYDPDLGYGATYYWRVDAVDSNGVAQWPGDVWSFTTYKNTPSLVGNLDGDHDVDFDDLSIFASQWLNGPGCPTPDCADFNGTDGVNALDLAILANNWQVDNNTAPVANADSADIAKNTTQAIDVLINDSDADAGDVLSIISVTSPLHGSVTHTASDVTFTPETDWTGTTNFSYTISDGYGGEASAVVTVNVTDVDWYDAAREAARNKKRRVIHDNDGADMPYFIVDGDGDGDIDVKDFKDCRLTGLIGTQTDTLVYCTWSSGFGYFTHNTQIGTVFDRTDIGAIDFSHNQTRHYIDDYNTDSLEMVVDFCRDNGIEPVWSMRMNDTHNSAYTQLREPLITEHPEWLLGSAANPPALGAASWTGVDYTHQEIRDLAFAYVQEVCQNYDVDGVMLDFFRHAVFFKSHANGGSCSTAELDMMTQLVADIRAMADVEGHKKGHPILIYVRTPDDPEFCRKIGLDIERWMNEKLIDIWVPTGYWRHNSRQEIINLGHSYGIPVYPSLDESRADDSIARTIRNTDASYCGRAASWLLEGADGIYSFNYDDGYTRYGYYSRLAYLGDLATLAPRNKTYTTTGRGYTTPIKNYTFDSDAYLGYDYILPSDKSKEVTTDASEDVNILIADDCSVGSPTVTLKLRSDAGFDTNNLDVRFNGSLVTPGSDSSSRMYLDTNKGYTVEWRVKFLDTEGGAGNYMCIDASPQANKWWLLTIQESYGKVYAKFYGRSETYLLDSDSNNTSYHKLRVSVTSGGAALYVDDNPTSVLGTPFKSQTILPLRFGDFTNGPDAKYDIDYIYAYDGAALAGGTDPAQWTMKYDCNVHPTESTAILYSDGTYGHWSHNFGIYASASGGILHFNTMYSDRGTYFTVSEPSWYNYVINNSDVIQGWNTVNLLLKSGAPISIEDFIVDVTH